MGIFLENNKAGDSGLMFLLVCDGVITLAMFLILWGVIATSIMKPNSRKELPNDFCVWLLVGLVSGILSLIAALLWPITGLVMFLLIWCEEDGCPSCCGIKSGWWKRRLNRRMNGAEGGNIRDEESQSGAVDRPPGLTDGMELPSYLQAIAARP